MKKFTALAIGGIAAVFAVAAGVMVACADTPPVSVHGDQVGFATGAQFLWESQADQARDLDNIASTGAKWLRLDLPWPSIQQTATTPPASWNWGPFDKIISMARARGLSILGLPSYTPSWAKLPGSTGGGSPANPAQFATFVTQLVLRYKSQGVKFWEIWNEPNQAWSWSPPDPAAYTRLLIPTYAAIKVADPTAQVITAGLAPAGDKPGQEVAPVTFIKGIYAAGGKGSFDAMAVHPYTYPYMPNDSSTSSWSTFFRIPDIHNVMVSNGDGNKQIWLTEFGAPTGSGTGASPESNQVNMVKQGFVAKAQYPYTGPLIWYAARDAGTDLTDREQNFGLWRFDFSAKPAAATMASIIEGTVGISTAFTLDR
jgi:hypothetical protein